MQDGCLNCGGTIMPGQQYCPVCGQKTNTRRLTFRQLAAEFFQAVINIEKGLWTLVKGLAVKPGETAAAYTEGQRKKFFNPFAFMGLCIAAMILINSWVRPYTVSYPPDQAVLARITDPEIRQLYITSLERIEKAQHFVTRHMNTVSVLISPYFAFFLWLFFKRWGRNMAEITVAYILFTAFSNLASTLLVSPFLSWARGSGAYNPVLYGMMLLQTIYIAWGMKTFLKFGTGKVMFKILGVLVLAGVIGFILVFAAYFLYVYHGGVSVVLKYL